jgi:hypothetical protein
MGLGATAMRTPSSTAKMTVKTWSAWLKAPENATREGMVSRVKPRHESTIASWMKTARGPLSRDFWMRSLMAYLGILQNF